MILKFKQYLKDDNLTITNFKYNDLPSNFKKYINEDKYNNLYMLLLNSLENKKNRSIMPVINYDQDDGLGSWLYDNYGIYHTIEEIHPSFIQPTQEQIYINKIIKLINSTYQPSSIFISSDNKIIDGHHRWASDFIMNNKTTCIKYHEKYNRLNELIFHYSEYIINNSRKDWHTI